MLKSTFKIIYLKIVFIHIKVLFKYISPWFKLVQNLNPFVTSLLWLSRMNPQIRYPDPTYNPNGIKFSYDEMRTIDQMNPLSRPNDLTKFSSHIVKQ